MEHRYTKTVDILQYNRNSIMYICKALLMIILNNILVISDPELSMYNSFYFQRIATNTTLIVKTFLRNKKKN